jgi:pimeloyl-ACP methyl ester carboxylesterase
MRAEASPDDPKDASIFEETLNGIWGWNADELAVLKPWGFNPASISAPTAIWYDPNDAVLPSQHAEWLSRSIRGAVVKITDALGHGSEGDPVADWTQLNSCGA